MQSICPITLRRYKTDGNLFPSVSVPQKHPILSLPLKQLARLAQVEVQNSDERELLFLALFLQLPTVELAGQVPVPFTCRKELDLPSLYLSKLLELLPAIRAISDLAGFPTFRLSADSLLAIPTYLQILQDFQQYRRHIPKVLPGDSVELEEKLQLAKELARAGSIRRQQDKLTSGNVIEWAIQKLQASPIRAKLFRQALSKSGLSVDILQDLIDDCLDNLPEYSEPDALKKAWLLDKLRAILLEKLQLLESLGVDITTKSDYINRISSGYLIKLPDGSSIPNTATEVGKVLQKPQIEWTAPEVPETEPQRQDFKNDLAFQVAWRRWSVAHCKK